MPDNPHDIVLESVVFTSVLDKSIKRRIAAEMLRVVKPDGIVLWYDFHVNNPRNPDVRGVKKKEIRELFPACIIQLQKTMLAPPLGRIVAPYSSAIYSLLESMPPLRTHYLGIIRKSAGQ